MDAGCKVVRLGPLTIVTLPFEPFCGVGMELKEHFGPDTTLVLGYSNGNFGYLPSEDLYDRAQYEVRGAYKFYGYPNPVVRQAQRLIEDALFG